jgi:hypothetical protein
VSQKDQLFYSMVSFAQRLLVSALPYIYVPVIYSPCGKTLNCNNRSHGEMAEWSKALRLGFS